MSDFSYILETQNTESEKTISFSFMKMGGNTSSEKNTFVTTDGRILNLDKISHLGITNNEIITILSDNSIKTFEFDDVATTRKNFYELCKLCIYNKLFIIHNQLTLLALMINDILMRMKFSPRMEIRDRDIRGRVAWIPKDVATITLFSHKILIRSDDLETHTLHQIPFEIYFLRREEEELSYQHCQLGVNIYNLTSKFKDLLEEHSSEIRNEFLSSENHKIREHTFIEKTLFSFVGKIISRRHL